MATPWLHDACGLFVICMGDRPRLRVLIMKAHLIWPAFVDFSSLDETWVPHGVCQLATVANLAGHEVDVLDGRTMGKDGIKALLMTTDASFVGISVLSAYAGHAKELMEFVREKRPDIKVIIGGIHPTVEPEDFDSTKYDYLITGEGEVTFPKILSGEVPEPGPYGAIVEGETPDLDTLPAIDRLLVTIAEEPLMGLEKPFATVIIGRGCPYKCNFCYPAERTLFGKRVRYRPVENVVTELESLSVKSFMVHDDCFTAKPSYVEEFCRAIGDRWTWWCQGRADNVCENIDLVRRMRDSGLRGMILGFESGDDRVLESLDKQATVAENMEAARILKALGVIVWANIMFGTPFEPPSGVINTIAMLAEMRPDTISSTVFTPHPGSALYDYCKEKGLIPEHDYGYYNRGTLEQKIATQDVDFLRWAMAQIGGLYANK